MKIHNRFAFNCKTQPTNITNFEGKPLMAYNPEVKGYADALKCWEKLRFAKYLDVHDDKFCPHYKEIRAKNYSFLDELKTYWDKSEFIRNFCEFTKFPNLKASSDNIRSTFDKCVTDISRTLNSSTSGVPYKVLDWGYDPTCSLGLNKSFPGSDLDKGYIILEGNHSYKSDSQIIGEFSGKLWDNLDQRIVSLNHPDTFPSIYTKRQVSSQLRELDEIADKVIRNKILNCGWEGVKKSWFLGPFAPAVSMVKMIEAFDNEFVKPYNTTNPYDAANFNRAVAKEISSSTEREKAKNFAFFIETVRANLERDSYGKYDSIFSEIKESTFANKSNVTQIEAWQNKINGGYMKSKLRNREQLQSDFYKMDMDTKYELVKEIIKYSSDDNSGRFSKYFKNDDDIANRYEPLLEALK